MKNVTEPIWLCLSLYFSRPPPFAQPPAGPHNEMDVVEKHCLNVQIPPLFLWMVLHNIEYGIA